MEAGRFETLKRSLSALTVEQCLELSAMLRDSVHERMAEVVVARGTAMVREARQCRRCGHRDVVLHGRDAGGRQRFRCRRGTDAQGVAVGCGRTFNGLAGTVLEGMRMQGKWVGFASAMHQHISVEKLAEKAGVARLTAFRWRQKLLSVQSLIETKTLQGVVEADETFFRSSYKGSRGWKRGRPPENRRPRYRGGQALLPGLSGEQIPVVTALDRLEGVVERVLPDRSNIHRVLSGRIQKGSVLCSDGLAAYVRAAEDNECEHRRIKLRKKDWLDKAKGDKPRRKDVLGLGRVNHHHREMKTILNFQANGVSTAKLPGYLGWHRAIKRKQTDPSDLLLSTLLFRRGA